MILPLDEMSALRALRVWRREGRVLPTERIDLPEPDPAPQRRWSARLIPLDRLDLERAPSHDSPLHVLSPTATARPQASFVSAHVLGTLPEGSFVDLGDGLVIPCPELLFLRLAGRMSPESHALVGYELCGTYARDASDARLGETVFGLAPATSTEAIRHYLDAYGARNGVILSRHDLASVRDNAWSPMEAIVALMALLPSYEQGYELGSITLNQRVETRGQLARLGVRGSRVPDIQVDGSHVGLNYDGSGHLDLDSIVAATRGDGDVEAAVRAVREKSRDDALRTRELMAGGSVILPVTSADLFLPGGLDAVMLELALAREHLDGVSSHGMRTILTSRDEARLRQKLIWSLLPWEPGVAHAREILELMPWRAPQTRFALPW